MNKSINKSQLVSLAVSLIPFIISLFYYSRLPDQVGIQVNFSGAVSRYAPRELAAFGIPGLLLAFQLLRLYSMKKDPNRDKITASVHIFRTWTVPVISVALELLIIVIPVLTEYKISRYIMCAAGLLLTIIGDYFSYILRNNFANTRIFGIIQNEEARRKAIGFADCVWVFGGMAVILLSLMIPNPLFTLIILAPALILPLVNMLLLNAGDKKAGG